MSEVMKYFYKNKRVFVSGGAGVIGRELVRLLCDWGAFVFVGDLKPRPADFPKQVIYRQGDLNYITRHELGSFAPELFIHLADTFERSTETYDFWSENFRHNVRLSHHLMTVLKDSPILKRVIFASSYLIYDPRLYQFSSPRSAAVSLKEDSPIAPRNLTGMAKLSHEIELSFLDQFRQESFSSCCVRIFRGYGRGSRDIISRWVRTLVRGEPIDVYREEGAFDFTYSKDNAEGLLRIAAAHECPPVVNLGTGQARRVSDVLQVLRGHFPGMTEHHIDSDIPFEASQADISVMRTVTDWQPAYRLEDALPEIIEYERLAARSAKTPRASRGSILLTSASRKVPLVRRLMDASKKLSSEIRVIAADSDAECLAGHVTDDFFLMRPIADIDVDRLIKDCLERDVRLILPTRDGELQFWADQAEKFQNSGIRVEISPPQTISLCLDKLQFSEFGAAKSLPTIPASTNIAAFPDARLVVKERFGAGSGNIGLNMTAKEALRHKEHLKHPVFQPFIEGDEISADAWFDQNGQPKGLVLRRRDVVRGGESVVTTTFRDAVVEETILRFLSSMPFHGPVIVQALIDEDGVVHIIECNPRVGGASTAAIEAGLDSLYWSVLQAFDVDVSQHPFCRIAGEVQQVRVPADDYKYIDT